MRCLALVAHNHMKGPMREFVRANQDVLRKFRLTGTNSTITMLKSVLGDTNTRGEKEPIESRARRGLASAGGRGRKIDSLDNFVNMNMHTRASKRATSVATRPFLRHHSSS